MLYAAGPKNIPGYPHQSRVKRVHYVLLGAASLTAVVSLWAYVLGFTGSDEEVSKAFVSGSKILTSPRQYALSMGLVSVLLAFAGYVGAQTLSESLSTGFLSDSRTASVVVLYLLALLTSIPILIFTIVEAVATMPAAKASANRAGQDLLAGVVVAAIMSAASSCTALAAGSISCLLGQREL